MGYSKGIMFAFLLQEKCSQFHTDTEEILLENDWLSNPR